nr:uncharacterized protein LOC109745732 [Aegilops tauschii subsp. strangulata]
MDPICGTEQKGNTYWTEIWKEFHEQKEYVQPHPIVSTRNVASPQHHWGLIQGEVNKYVGYYLQLTKRSQSGMRVATLTTVATTLYHEVEKKPLAFSHCWILLNGKPKWNQLVAELKYGKKRNDGSSSNQSIGLYDEDDNVFVTNGKATVPKDNRYQNGGYKKEERYKLLLDAQKERMKWGQKRAEKKLEIEREKVELEKQQAAIKWELGKTKTFGDIELEKERL